MKIIDFERKGNLVRFYLGDDDLAEWWGDESTALPVTDKLVQVELAG